MTYYLKSGWRDASCDPAIGLMDQPSHWTGEFKIDFIVINQRPAPPPKKKNFRYNGYNNKDNNNSKPQKQNKTIKKKKWPHPDNFVSTF